MSSKLSPFITLLSIFLFSLQSSPVFAQKEFTLCYDPYPPYTLGKSGTPSGGTKVKLAYSIFEQIDGVDIKVVLLPWKQCQKQTKAGVFDGILPLFKNAERSEYMVFSNSVFDQVSTFWYKRERFPDGIRWQQFTDLSEYKLGMLIGSYIDSDMEAIFKANKGVSRGKTVDNLFQLLLKERVDLIAIDEGVGHYSLQQLGLESEIVKVEKPMSSKESYFGFAKKSELSTYLDEVNQVIAKLHKDGTIERIRTGQP